MEEPSVLDYLKSKLLPWRRGTVVLPPPQPEMDELDRQAAGADSDGADRMDTAAQPARVPRAALLATAWRPLVGLGLALMAQRSLEPAPGRGWAVGVGLYLLAGAFLAWAVWRKELQAAEMPQGEAREHALTVNYRVLVLAFVLTLTAYLTFGGNQFTSFNVTIWLLAIGFLIWGLWLPGSPARSWGRWLLEQARQRSWNIPITRWNLAVLAVAVVVLFFRLTQLEQVPPEMVSDHAEKLLDVWDVLEGQTSIFFVRNTGREAMQMYLTAWVAQVFKTGISFLSLKMGTVLAGLLTLPFIYLLGKEVANRRVGLLATLFAGIAYWPNVISRVGLRFPLYPLFVAPTLYYLVRGLKNSSRNDFILAGLALGIGLHGYTPIRILPFVVVIAVGIYLIHAQAKGARRGAVFGLFILAIVSLVVFTPLLRYVMENPQAFSYRSLTRLGSVERPLPGPAWQIFVSNLWNAMTMFAWDNGEIWVLSVTHRPALDVVSGALFHVGVLVLIIRYVRQRHWLDLFILLSIPLLMLPSILSLAFPSENPSLNRMGGAIVPVFLVVGIAGDAFWRTTQERAGAETRDRASTQNWLAPVLGVFLLTWSGTQNYDLVFRQYQGAYKGASWNTSEMGHVIRTFAETVGGPDNAWVVAYQHWVDTRLVGMNAGYPLKDYAIAIDQISETRNVVGAKLFLIKPEDDEGLQTLFLVYPDGVVQLYESDHEGHNFLMYFVTPER